MEWTYRLEVFQRSLCAEQRLDISMSSVELHLLGLEHTLPFLRLLSALELMVELVHRISTGDWTFSEELLEMFRSDDMR